MNAVTASEHLNTRALARTLARKWPSRHPDRLQLYSLPTPNGVKVSIMLEECCVPYEAHLVSFERNDQMSPELLVVVDVLPVPMRPEYIVLYISLAGFARAAA